MESINDGFRFILEVCALASLSYWGFKAHGSTAAKWGSGIGTPLLAIVAWALFVPPNASMRLDDPWKLFVELTVFGSATIALLRVGKPAWSSFLATAVTIHLVLTFVLNQR